MQAELLRKDGQILLMETGSDFVDLLTTCLAAPLGSIASAAKKGIFSELQESLHALRPAVFQDSKNDALQRPFDLSNAIAPLTFPEISVMEGNMSLDGDPSEGGPFTLLGTGSNHGNHGAAFLNCNVANFGFELVVREPDAGVSYMIGIAPEDMMSVTQLQQQNMHQSLGFYLSPTKGYWYLNSECGDNNTPMASLQGVQIRPCDRLSMRFTPCPVPKLEYKVREEEWQEAKFAKPIKKNVRYCPVLLLVPPHKKLEVEKCVTSGPSTKMHPMAKFVITNELEVSESSALKALQITQQMGVDMKDVEVTSMLITPMHIQRMLARAFMGQSDVLSYMFSESLPHSVAPSMAGSQSEASYAMPK